MSKASNIGTLSALRERREEIKAEQQTARRGFTTTLAAAPQRVKDYALEDLALPALGIGLATYVGYRVLRSNNHRSQPAADQRSYVQSAPQPEAQPQRARPEITTAYTPPPVQPSPHPTPVQRTRQQEQTREVVKKSFNFATVIAAGKLLIPAAQAIIGVIQNQQAKVQTKQQLDGAKQEIVSEVDAKK